MSSIQSMEYMNYIAADVCAFRELKKEGYYNLAMAVLSQIVEKALKALKVNRSGYLSNSLKKGHNLKKIAEGLNLEGISPNELKRLSEAYYQGRYPDTKKMYCREEVESGEHMTMKILKILEEEVGIPRTLKEEIDACNEEDAWCGDDACDEEKDVMDVWLEERRRKIGGAFSCRNYNKHCVERLF